MCMLKVNPIALKEEKADFATNYSMKDSDGDGKRGIGN